MLGSGERWTKDMDARIRRELDKRHGSWDQERDGQKTWTQGPGESCMDKKKNTSADRAGGGGE